LTNLDLTLPDKTLKRVGAVALVDFTTTNRVFNPVAWVKTADGRLARSEKVGPAAVTATNITALLLRLTFESVSQAADGSPKYLMGIEKQNAARVSDRIKKTPYVKMGEKLDTFKLVAVNGPPDNPESVIMESSDTGERVTVSKEQPYKRIEGYQADLKYAPQSKHWDNQRLDGKININGEDYKIVAITPNEVILIAPNQKKWIIKATPRPE